MSMAEGGREGMTMTARRTEAREFAVEHGCAWTAVIVAIIYLRPRTNSQHTHTEPPIRIHVRLRNLVEGRWNTHVENVTRYPPGVRDSLCGVSQPELWENGMAARTTAKFQGPSSPQLHILYSIGRPVALSAMLMLLYRS